MSDHTGLTLRALRAGQLRLHYQPIVALGSGRLVGAEALLRWQHPDRGLLGPVELLEDAERTGCLVELGRWVIDTAVAERAHWPGELVVTINVTPVELAEGDLLGTVLDACARHGVSPTDVCLEVTEGEITDLAAVRPTLTALTDHGIRLALDDFGAGHTSFARLRELPFQICKLDRSFNEGLHDDARIVRGIVELAQGLGMLVIAEGIEAGEPCRHLRDLGCDLGQGFGLVRPQPAERLRELLRDPNARHLPAAASPAEHQVLLYEHDLGLARSLVDDLATDLGRGDAALLVVTDDHLSAAAAALTSVGVDVAAAERTGQLVLLDVDELLDALLVDGRIETDGFEHYLEPVVADAVGSGRRLRVVGELGARLWERGDIVAALDLEAVCARASREVPLSITCVYPLATLGAAGDAVAFERMCNQHDHVVPLLPEGTERDADARNRNIAHLQRDAASIAAWRGTTDRAVHEIRNASLIAELAIAQVDGELQELDAAAARELLGFAREALDRIARAADTLGATGASSARVHEPAPEVVADVGTTVAATRA